MNRYFDTNAPALLTDLKIANRRTVLSAFRRGAVCSASDLSAQTGISRPTVVKCIRFFQDNGLLVSLGKGKSTATGGKRPENYALSQKRYFLTLAMWPQELRAYLYTIGHELLGSIVFPEPLPETPSEASRQAATLAARLLREQCVLPSDVCAVSVSTSGTIDRETNTLMFSSHTPLWGTRVHLLDDLHALFGDETPIYMENAGKMCARPFLLDHELRGKRVLVLFTTWGVSSCFIERGHIMNGPNSLIGEVGHMTIDPSDPEPCGCGSRGCFERLVSPARVRRMVREAAADYPASPLPLQGEQLSIPALFAASEGGDALAQAISRRLAGIFALVLRNISLVFDPDCVVFQGDYASADEIFRTTLREEMAGFHYYPSGIPFEIRADHRPLAGMDAEGAFIALDHLYFSNPALYRDQAAD